MRYIFLVSKMNNSKANFLFETHYLWSFVVGRLKLITYGTAVCA